MTKIKFLLMLIVLAALSYLGYSLISKNTPSEFPQQKNTASLSKKVTPTPTPIPTPIFFQFTSSTDLKQELESVNPQVKDSDFQKLDEILPSN